MNELADLLLKVPGEAWIGGGVVALVALVLGYRRKAKDASARSRTAGDIVRANHERDVAFRAAEDKAAAEKQRADAEHARTTAELREVERRIDTATPDELVDEINRTFGKKP